MPMIDPTSPQGALSSAQRAELVNERTTVLLSAGERRSYTASTLIHEVAQVRHRDRLAAAAWHKHVPARLAPIA